MGRQQICGEKLRGEMRALRTDFTLDAATPCSHALLFIAMS